MSKRSTQNNNQKIAKENNSKGKENKVEAKEQLLVDSPSRWQSWWVRTNFTLLMIGGFALLLWLGHFAVICLIFVLQIIGFRELLKVRDVTSKPNSRSLSEKSKFIDYILFGTAEYFAYGWIFFSQFPELTSANPFFSFLSRYHLIITFSSLAFLLVIFVWNLEKDNYKKQFQLIGWTICIIFLLSTSNFHIYNIFQGLFWFLLSTSLIICNDIAAYIWGFAMGRTPLIQLSPKKTWEGFLGALLSTVVFGFFFPLVLLNAHFICPRIALFSSPSTCELTYPFIQQEYPIPSFINDFLQQFFGLHWGSQRFYPVQIYGVIFALFASTIAPFGGFLASGLKRGYGIKDFGDLIPGHGGIVDRMDCQVMMAAFCYCFYITYVASQSLYVNELLSHIFSLEPHYQIEIYQKLHSSLLAQNLL